MRLWRADLVLRAHGETISSSSLRTNVACAMADASMRNRSSRIVCHSDTVNDSHSVPSHQGERQLWRSERECFHTPSARTARPNPCESLLHRCDGEAMSTKARDVLFSTLRASSKLKLPGKAKGGRARSLPITRRTGPASLRLVQEGHHSGYGPAQRDKVPLGHILPAERGVHATRLPLDCRLELRAPAFADDA